MDRITQKDLNILVDQINALTDSPMTQHTNTGRVGGLTTNIDNYHLDYNRNGVRLVRAIDDHPLMPKIKVISTGGFGTKKQLFHWMSGFIAGIKL